MNGIRRRVLPRAILFVLAIGLPTWADADSDQYEPFNRQNVNITDHYTGLVWARRVGASATYAGVTCPAGTRLPTLKELLTLVDETPHDEYTSTGTLETKMIDRDAFPDTPVDEPYWTSSPATAPEYFTVDFKTGVTASARPGDSRNYRCVRALTP